MGLTQNHENDEPLRLGRLVVLYLRQAENKHFFHL